MTKSRAKVLTLAERDSHRNTMNIHRETANRVARLNEFTSAVNALKLALPHANIIGDKTARSEIFSQMNSLRAKAKRNTAALPNPWTDAPEPSTGEAGV